MIFIDILIVCICVASLTGTLSKRNTRYRVLRHPMAVVLFLIIVCLANAVNLILHDILVIIRVIQIARIFSLQHRTSRLLWFLITLRFVRETLTWRLDITGEWITYILLANQIIEHISSPIFFIDMNYVRKIGLKFTICTRTKRKN